jgi:HK97 family phage major capsid protein
MRPAGMRPAGMRPAGMRPAGMRPAEGVSSYLDPDEWSADVAALFCEYSAVLRLGAQLVFGLSDLPVLAKSMLPTPRYLPEPVLVDDDAEHPAPDGAAGEQEVADVTKKTATRLSYRRLRPKSHELTVQVAVRNRLVTTIVVHPEVAWALKQDIASALAFRADQGFLHGKPKERAPRGIASLADTEKLDQGENPLSTARAMVKKLRSKEARFLNPGWILHPKTLDLLGEALQREAAKGDAGQLLTYDGADGGTLLGYPYVVSAAAGDTSAHPPERMFLASDWAEAWVGAQEPLVTVDVAPSVLLERDETLIRAVTQHDFALRAPSTFVHTGEKAAQKPAKAPPAGEK